MAGIYLHIPFCKQKCHYCNFFSLASHKHKDIFISTLIKEIKLQTHYLKGEEVSTIYIGGGTPSLFSSKEIQGIITTVKEEFTVSTQAEITLEANPDDLNEEFLAELGKTFVNRLSIGVQSFFDDDLHYLNRVHNSADARKAVERAKNAGFNNLTLDLIYGIPTLTKAKWLSNIKQFLELDIPHLSAYALTVEPKTALSSFIAKGKMQAVDDAQAAEHFDLLVVEMEKYDFVHYEISNFAKQGHYSRHNSIYWSGGNYLGLGPSAHSYNGHTRQWNVSNLAQYLKLSDHVTVVEEKEVLTLEQRYNEYVMTSLRTVWGCDLEHIANTFGEKFSERCTTQALKFLTNGQLIKTQSKLYLTSKGKFFADGIAAQLFV
jgi:oxygen-independent coproporphyrinogen III oxidase